MTKSLNAPRPLLVAPGRFPADPGRFPADPGRSPKYQMESDAAVRSITRALKNWTLKRRTLTDANGRALPDGERTKLLPSGTDGIALEITLEEDGNVFSTRIEKEQHELRICKLDTSILREKAGLTSEQLVAMIALMATFDVICMTNVPPGESLSAASAMKNLLSHHSGDGFDLVLLPGKSAATVFLRLPLAVLKSIDHVTFYDSRFKHQSKVKTLSVLGNNIFLADGEEPVEVDKGTSTIHDGWLHAPKACAVDVQRVGLEVQISDLSDLSDLSDVSDTPKSEGGGGGGGGEGQGGNNAELFCAKMIDAKQ
ncbi:hypothetical protein N9S81_00415 [bacterium]|nr:hypothetical protein [bacterium]